MCVNFAFNPICAQNKHKTKQKTKTRKHTKNKTKKNKKKQKTFWFQSIALGNWTFFLIRLNYCASMLQNEAFS
jgi:hypothetical protein